MPSLSLMGEARTAGFNPFQKVSSEVVTSTEKVLQQDDVLLQVGDYPVGRDGTVLYQGNRVGVSAAFQTAQEGETLPIKVWRKGEELSVALPMHVYRQDRFAGNQYDLLPKYFVYGGMVFTPLSADYLRSAGRDFNDPGNTELVYELYYRRNESPSTARPEPIVLAATLAHPVNANHRTQNRALVDQINGVRIEKLEDVIRAIETSQAEQHVVEFLPSHSFECMDRSEAEKANPQILKTYGISSDRRL